MGQVGSDHFQMYSQNVITLFRLKAMETFSSNFGNLINDFQNAKRFQKILNQKKRFSPQGSEGNFPEILIENVISVQKRLILSLSKIPLATAGTWFIFFDHNAPFFRIKTTCFRFYPTSSSLSEFVIKSILPFDIPSCCIFLIKHKVTLIFFSDFDQNY